MGFISALLVNTAQGGAP